MASFSVQYIFTLQDRFSAQSRKLAAAAKTMAQPIRAAGNAANAAASGLARYGAMAAKAASQVNTLAKAQVAAFMGGRGGRRGREMGAGAAFGSLGIAYWGRMILNEAREASKAENKFRALVDSVTDDQMARLRKDIQDQMSRTGESFATLMDAAGDAAQIVGDADLARSITIAASKLAKIDTAGKTTQDFAESVAAIVGPDGTLAEVVRMADMLAQQQKLGAATAGGSIEAYKNVVGEQVISRFNTAEMLTAIGLIKNKAPALQDSQIGNMGKYGIRALSQPINGMREKLEKHGLSSESFFTDGKFDIAKTQAMFHEMTKTAEGLKKFKDIFAGRNVLAGQFWSMLAGIDPKEFEKYRAALEGSVGVLDLSFDERLKGLEGAMNRIDGAAKKAAIALGIFLTPAMEQLAGYATTAANNFVSAMEHFQATNPELATIAGLALTAAAALAAFALPLAAVAWAFRTLGIGALVRGLAGFVGVLGRLALGGLAGVFTGIAAGAARIGRAVQLGYRFAGALGAAAIAARALRRLLVFVVAVEGATWLWDNWDKIRASIENPMQISIIWPEAPEWFKVITQKGAQSVQAAREQTAGVRTALEPVGEFFSSAWSRLFGGAPSPVMPPQMPLMPPSSFKADDIPAWDMPTRNPSRLPQSEAERDISVRTSLDPIKITVPQSIDVNVRGQVNGPLTGSGSIPVGATAPRGKSTAAPAAPVAP
ncbi:MAG: hypothetical protein NW216_07600 [Hyphomicrobium sp.]|nr:hypothetical protein [Hyphomicrobium sp.]